MAGQYALPGRPSLAGPAGAPQPKPSVAAAHQLLDMPLGEAVKKFAPQYADKVPPEKAGLPVREALKSASFMEKQFIMGVMGPHLPKGVTAADIETALKEAPPTAEKPAATPPPAAVAAPAAAAPAAAAPAAAPPQQQTPQPAVQAGAGPAAVAAATAATAAASRDGGGGWRGWRR